MYEERFYRSEFSKDWFSCAIAIKETDVLIKSQEQLDAAVVGTIVGKYRKEVEEYIKNFPEFKHALSPVNLKEPCSPIIRDMIEKSALVKVGPMASVAGAIAEYVGRDLLDFTPQVLVENGGDIFIRKEGKATLGLYAGQGSFINDFTITVGGESPLGVCSSSSSLGHSASLGRADLATVISESVVFADALATKLANMVQSESDIEDALTFSKKFSLVKGLLLIKRGKLGMWGDLKLSRR